MRLLESIIITFRALDRLATHAELSRASSMLLSTRDGQIRDFFAYFCIGAPLIHLLIDDYFAAIHRDHSDSVAFFLDMLFVNMVLKAYIHSQ